MNLGEKLLKLRKEKGLSQEALAEQIKTTRQRGSGIYVLGTGRHSILYVSESFLMASAWYGGVYFPWNLCGCHRYVS